MASLVLGVAGAFVGSFFGAPQIGFAIGSALGSALFPPPGKDGPRLTDLKVQNSQYGAAIPIVYGAYRVAGNIIWADELQEHAEEQDSGSGGGGATNYTYTCSFAVSICEGPIAGLRRIWADGKLIYENSATGAQRVGYNANGGTLYKGDEEQTPDPTMEAVIGVGLVPAHRGMAYFVFTDLQLGKYGNRLPNLTFEVVTKGIDIPPDNAFVFGQTHTASVDYNTGYVWTNPQEGTATGAPGSITLTGSPKKQIHVYDPVTTEVVKYYDVPAFEEHDVGGSHPVVSTYYPSGGVLVVTGGWAFVASGTAGAQSDCHYQQEYPLGMSFLCDGTTGSFMMSGYNMTAAFNNVFFWPTVPIPCADNNGVYMAGGNGLSGGFAPGFMPGALVVGPDTTYYSPDRTGNRPQFQAPLGWVVRTTETGGYKGDCSKYPFGVVTGNVPDWAFKVTTVETPSLSVVQGYGGYISFGSYSPPITTGPALAGLELHHHTLPVASSTDIPRIVYDPIQDCCWAFCDMGDGKHSRLYRAERLGVEDQAYDIPGSVLGGGWDYARGMIRLLMDSNADGVPHIVLFNPMTRHIVEDVKVSIDTTIYSTNIPQPNNGAGQVYNYESKSFMIYNQGSQLWKIPYNNPLESQGLRLSEVVADISRRCGLPPNEYDVVQLTDLVNGYALPSNMTARSAIEPLAQGYFFDAVESDNKVKFVKRGKETVIEIDTSETLLQDRTS
jgi:hypothetical protein